MEEISLLDIVRILWRRLWLILLVGVLCGAIAFVYCTMFAVPKYSAKVSILGSNGGFGAESMNNTGVVNGGDVSTSQNLTDTIIYILKKMPSENQAFVDKLKENGLIDTFNSSSVGISNQTDTSVIEVTIMGTNPQGIVQIANIFASCSSDYISSFNIGMIKTISKANGASKTSPNTTRTVALAFLLGAIVVAVIVFLRESLDNTINGEENLREKHDIPVLGTVPDFQTISKEGSAYYGR